MPKVAAECYQTYFWAWTKYGQGAWTTPKITMDSPILENMSFID